MKKAALSYESARPVIVRTVAGFALLFLLIRWACGTMLHQLEAPPVRTVGYNFTAWLYRALGLEELLLGGEVASIVFTALLLGSGLLALLFPLRRVVLFLFWLCYLTYALLFNVGTAVSGYSQAFLTLALIPFWAAPRGHFTDWWAAARYYACWMYGSAFLFKIFRGAFWVWEDGVRTVKANFAAHFYLEPDWLWMRFIHWWLEHPALLNAGYKIFILLEGLFLIGFFTRRYDRVLIWSAVVIILCTLVFADANFLEMGAMVFPFISSQFWQRKQTGNAN